MTDTPTIPDMVPVKSSNVESVGYHEPSQTLHIKFKTGGHYSYPGVTPEAHKAFVGAESVGKHFSQNILGKFPHTKLKTDAT